MVRNTWEKKSDKGPSISSSRITYYDKSLYTWGEIGINGESIQRLYKYDIDSDEWSIVDISSTYFKRISSPGFCEYKDNLLIINGFDISTASYLNSSISLNLKSEHKKWEILEVGYLDSQSSFGYICNGSKIYIFGGLSFSGHKNQLVELNLESPAEITVLSESIRIPTPRYGHGMIVYDEKLLIFGGVDKYENE